MLISLLQETGKQIKEVDDVCLAMSVGEELCRPCHQVPWSPATLPYYIKVCHPQKNSAAGMLNSKATPIICSR